jgi:hypothetical protein
MEKSQQSEINESQMEKQRDRLKRGKRVLPQKKYKKLKKNLMV